MIPFEDFLFYDSEKNSCPADAVTILHLEGIPDFPRLEAAIRQAAKRSPIASQFLQMAPDGTLSPGQNEIPLAIHRIQGLPTPQTFPNSAIPITREPGIRFWLYEDPESEKSQLWLQFHHVTSDALGSFIFLNEIFENYAGQIPERQALPSEKDLQKTCRPRCDVPLVLCALKQIFSFLGRALNPWQPKPLELKEAQADGTSDFPEILPHLPILFQTLEPDETQKILNAARSLNVSLNDFVLTAAFIAAARLQAQLPASSQRKTVQIAVPVSFRRGPFLSMPLRNLASVVFLEETRRQILAPKPLFLQKIHHEMRQRLKNRWGELLFLELKWLAALRRHGNHRWGMEWFVQRKTPLATLVLSNLGILFRGSPLPKTPEGFLLAGNLTLKKIQQASPRTTNTALTIAMGTYANRLHFGIHHDPKRLSDASTLQFQTFLMEEINALCACSAEKIS